MRIVIAGGGDVGKYIAEDMIKKGHEVILIEKDEARAKKLAEELDCAVIKGDATYPDTLKSVDIGTADWVIVSTGEDKDNILIGLLARDFGAKKVTIMLEDVSYETLAVSLGFEDVIVPTRLAALQIINMISGLDKANIMPLVKGDARFLRAFIGGHLDGVKVSEIKLPEGAMMCAVYRGEKYMEPKPELELKAGDEVLIIVREKDVSKVKQIFEKEGH